jgi:aminoglycoside phosphotransferase (APT) family kinase protein
VTGTLVFRSPAWSHNKKEEGEMGATSMDTSAVNHEQLSGFLADNVFPDATEVAVTEVEPASSGFSNDTVLFEVAYRENGQQHRRWLVARIAPARPALFPAYDMGLQHGVMLALSAHTDLPMAPIRGKYDDTSIFGAPFFLMDRVDGWVPADDPPFTVEGHLLELTADQQGAILDQSLAILAKIHAVDWKGLGLAPVVGYDPSQDALRAKLAEAENFHHWVAGDTEDPLVEAGFAWLYDNRPAAEEGPVLNWGDARIGNMILDRHDNRTLAVLDWEMSCIASRELDLGWYTFALRYFTEGIGAPIPQGFPSREGIIARYEELTGYTVRDHHYYEVFAGLRTAIITRRIANLLIAAGMLPEDSDMAANNPGSHLLAHLLGLPPVGPAPTGTFTRG